METEKEKSGWPEVYYPGIHSKHVNEFAWEFQLSTNPDKKEKEKMKKQKVCIQQQQQQPIPPPPPPAPVFPDDILTQFQPLDISKGKTLDVTSLLSIGIGSGTTGSSNNGLVRFHFGSRFDGCGVVVDDGVGPTCLKGKHVMLLCFHAPIPMNTHVSYRFVDYSMFANHMHATHSDKFVAVVVVKMKPGWAHHEAAFSHFVSAFSPSCLVVPFRHTTRIDAICRCMGLKDETMGVFVDPNGVIVYDTLNYVGSTAFLHSFPFYNPNPLNKSWYNHPLDQLLCCQLLTRPYSEADTGYSISISDLAKYKVVGLYLCVRGTDIPKLHEVYKQCQARHLDFEVVLVYSPFLSGTPPNVTDDFFSWYFRHNKIPFWVSPFNYGASRRLYSLPFGGYPMDKLYIVSYGKLVDLDGDEYVRRLGVNAYPFDRESIIQKGLAEIKKITLESVLEAGGGSLRRGNCPNEEVTVHSLKGHNVLVFLGEARSRMGKDLYNLIDMHYDEIKNKDDGFEVIIVCLDATVTVPIQDCMSSNKWLVFPNSPESVIQGLSLWGMILNSSLFAFGPDGMVSSLDAENAVDSRGSDAFPFCDDLCEQVATMLRGCLCL